MITTSVIVPLTLLQLIIYAACGFDKGANRMPGEIAKTHECARGEDDCGCRFVIEGANPGAGSIDFCNAPRGADSAYCPRHHALCHLPKGSAAEGRQLREIAALAEAVGGRMGREM